MASLPYSSRERDEAVDLIESNRSEAAGSSNAVSLSVVVVLNGPKVMYPVRQLYEDYDRHVQSHVESYEIIFVVDGDFPIESEDVEYLRSCGRHVTILRFAKRFGYAACLSAGFERVAGDVILTLPSYHQVAPERLPLLIGALDNFDMVVARRWPRIDSWLNRAQTFVFNSLIKASLSATDSRNSKDISIGESILLL